MTAEHRRAGLPPAFLAAGSSSFTEFLQAHSPESMPVINAQAASSLQSPHGTTIVALTYAGGVLVAGDRRATMGNLIASHDLRKVFAADDYSAVGIAGTAGIAIELVRLFQVEPGTLREAGRRPAVPRRQGTPAGRDDPRQPGHGHAGPVGGAVVRRL